MSLSFRQIERILGELEEVLLTLGFLRALDRASAGRNAWPDAGVKKLLKVLQKPGSLGDVCARFGLFEDEAEEEHVRRDWFNEGGKGWWPKEPMEALFRTGMSRAIQLLRQHDLPLASYWRVGRRTRRVQITFAVGAHQITLLLSTPPPRILHPGGRVAVDPKVWVVTHDDRNRIVSHAGRRPIPDREPLLNSPPCPQ